MYKNILLTGGATCVRTLRTFYVYATCIDYHKYYEKISEYNGLNSETL